jgi:hypothetical protein
MPGLGGDGVFHLLAGGAMLAKGAGGAAWFVFETNLVSDGTDGVAEGGTLGLGNLMLQAAARRFQVFRFVLDHAQAAQNPQGGGVQRNGVAAQACLDDRGDEVVAGRLIPA